MEKQEADSKEQSQEESQQSKMVPISEASDEDLAAFMAANREVADDSDDDEDDDDEESAEDAEQDEEGPEDDEEEESDDEEDSEASDDRPQPEGTDELSQLKARIAELETDRNRGLGEKQQREQFIQRLKTELGTAKKALTDRITEVENHLKEHEDSLTPRQIVEAQIHLREVSEELGKVERREQDIEIGERSRGLYAKNFGEEPLAVDEIVSLVLERDKMPAQFIESFKQDPYTFSQPETLIQFAKRAKLQKVVDRLIPFTKDLIAKVRKLEGKPAETVKRINKELKKTPKISSVPKSSKKVNAPSRKQVAEMSDAELEELKKSLR